MWHGEMRMQIDYFLLRNYMTCFKFIFLHYHIHKEIHHLVKWALKKTPPLQHVSRRNKHCHHIMRFAFTELFGAVAHQHNTLLERTALIWSNALCTDRRFHLHSHVKPEAPEQ